jgi:hypothetical protein
MSSPAGDAHDTLRSYAPLGYEAQSSLEAQDIQGSAFHHGAISTEPTHDSAAAAEEVFLP